MFNRSEILKAAWQSYRLARMGIFLPTDDTRRAFIPSMFAKCLRAAWADARKRTGWMTPVAVRIEIKPAVLKPSRAAEIRSELDRMQYRDFIDWNIHRTLSVELAMSAT
jgi:hypothetical protein